MRDIMQKYHIPCDTSLEDWRSDLWRCVYLGDVAINNLSAYMVQALTRAGYSNSQIVHGEGKVQEVVE